MYKNNLDTRTLGKMYEEVAFEAPAIWDIEACIENGMLEKLVNKTDAITKSYNDNGKQIDRIPRHFHQEENYCHTEVTN
mgnify:CR=1 FL=1